MSCKRRENGFTGVLGERKEERETETETQVEGGKG